MLSKYSIFCIALFLSTALIQAQESSTRLFIKGGVSDYGGLQGISIAGSHGAGPWNSGLILGMGTEIDIKKGFFIQITLEHSGNEYGALVAEGEKLERGKTNIVELMGNIKKRWNWFYLIAGLGLSFQSMEDSYLTYYIMDIPFRRLANKGEESSTSLSSSLGFGFEVSVSSKFNIFLEGSLRMKLYVTPVAELGISYAL